jgi:hypothetical protein
VFMILDFPTIEHAGDRSAQVRMMGAHKHWCTTMLAITTDGQKLSPFVIFRRKIVLKDKCPPGIIVRVQKSICK